MTEASPLYDRLRALGALALVVCSAIAMLAIVSGIALDMMGWFRERAEAQATWTPERIEAIRADPALRADLAQVVDLCRGFDRQLCHFAVKAARRIREADLEERNAALAAALRRAIP